MNFVAIDVETANQDNSSICQIGLATFKDGVLVDKWESLIDPETYFSYTNIGIHGITEDQIIGAPKFYQVHEELKRRMEHKFAVHHMPFDKSAINNVCSKYGLEHINTYWLDSAKVVRRTWTQFSKRGYGLANISNYLGIRFMHHNALEDAIAAGKVCVEACKINGTNIRGCAEFIASPSKTKYYRK